MAASLPPYSPPFLWPASGKKMRSLDTLFRRRCVRGGFGVRAGAAGGRGGAVVDVDEVEERVLSSYNGNGSAFAGNGSVNGALVGGNGSLGKYVNGNGAAAAGVGVGAGAGEVRVGVAVEVGEVRKRSVEEIGQEEAWFKQAGREKLKVVASFLLFSLRFSWIVPGSSICLKVNL